MLRISRIMAGVYLLGALAVTLFTLFVRPLGWAPFQIATVGPGGAPVLVTIAYSTEKEQWLTAAVARFAASNPRVGGRPVQIELRGLGSRELVSAIVDDQLQPTVASPASMVQIEQLRAAWAAHKGGTIIGTGSDAPQPLLLTPLVLVAWADRAAAVETAGSGNFWNDLHSVLTAPGGWAARGHPEWGSQVRFGHASPETSNSGLQTLLLLAYGYADSGGELNLAQVQDAGFHQWLAGIEKPIPAFDQSTSNLMTDMLRFGPGGKYDFVAVYENLAIEAIGTAANRGQSLRIFYPPANLLSDHPYAILDAPWVSAEQREAARQFRDFLLSPEMQSLALQSYGFRPASAQVRIDPNDPNSPFGRYAGDGVQLDIAEQVAVPSGDVIDALVATWRASIR